MTLDHEVDVIEALKKNINKYESKAKKFCNLRGNYRAKPWVKIQHYNSIVKLSSPVEGVESKVIFADKNLLDRFRLDLFKEDFNLKNQFINHFLFCNTSPSYPIGNVSVERVRKGQIVKGIQ